MKITSNTPKLKRSRRTIEQLQQPTQYTTKPQKGHSHPPQHQTLTKLTQTTHNQTPESPSPPPTQISRTRVPETRSSLLRPEQPPIQYSTKYRKSQPVITRSQEPEPENQNIIEEG
ncbi:bb5d2778-6978-45a3-bc45-a746db862301-CDS [Sclerotinia trifoliorum]|uniref:Bb5d2778-6978-45a3-bc45-a746db862301-CDS n=1 Tax=Sclerotinia trifoliorum TaxID=28548 RepID=A0A8H2W4W7_9HELO|nr:bb5d2778-6978-45a3-bc45-a746db862301-CDS [Sclerotinia trifoliorum]